MLPIHWELQIQHRITAGSWQERKSYPFHYWQVLILRKTAQKLFWHRFGSLYCNKDTEICASEQRSISLGLSHKKKVHCPGGKERLSSAYLPSDPSEQADEPCGTASSPTEPARPTWHTEHGKNWDRCGRGICLAESCSWRCWGALASTSAANQPLNTQAVMAPLLRAFFQVKALSCFAVGSPCRGEQVVLGKSTKSP